MKTLLKPISKLIAGICNPTDHSPVVEPNLREFQQQPVIRRRVLKALLPTCLMIVWLSLTMPAGNAAQSTFPDRIPQNANALTTLNYSALANSSWAKSNNVAAGELIGMPTSAKRVTFMAEVDYDYWTSAAPVVVAELDTDWKFDRLPESFAAQIDEVAGQKALHLKPHAVAVEIGDAYAILPNTSRQFAVRRVRDLTSTDSSNHDSVALRAAADVARQTDAFAVIAMDLRDSIPNNAIAEYCESANCLKDVDREEIQKLFTGVEGVTAVITATDTLNADIRIRFADDAASLKSIAAPLISDLLIGFGAKLDNLDQWKTIIVDNIVSVRGELSFDGLNDLMGLTVQDPQIPKAVRELSKALNLNEAESASQLRKENEKLTAAGQATAGYMLRLRNLLGSLQAKTGADASQSRFWLDRYALRIQQIDDDGVDELATQFADRTTNALRVMADTLQSTEIDRYRSRNGLATIWAPAAGLRSLSYGRVPVRRQGNFFGGYGLTAFAIGHALDRKATSEAFQSVKRSGFEVIRDYNVTGDAIGKKYGINFQPWMAVR